MRRHSEIARDPVEMDEPPLPSLLEAASRDEEEWRRFTIPVGEKLVYSVSWGPFRLGEVTIYVSEKLDHVPRWIAREAAAGTARAPGSFPYPPDFCRVVYRAEVSVKSSDYLKAIANVDYRIQSLIDAEGTYPWQYDEYHKEGSRRKDLLIEFDQRNHVAHYFKRKGEEKDYLSQGDFSPVADRVQDPLSVLYYARLMGLSLGQKMMITVHIDKRDWPTQLEVIGEEKVSTPIGTLDCWVIRSQYEYEGLFVASSEPRLWVEKRSRIPVKIDVDIPVGSVKVRLKEWIRGGQEK